MSENDNQKYDCLNVVVSHPAQQHSYHLARALEKKGSLFAYVTTVYFKESRLLYRLLKVVLNKDNIRRMRGRQNSFMESNLKQFNEISGLLFLFSQRILRDQTFKGVIEAWLGKAFGRKVAKFVNCNNVDIIICFDTFALTTFEGTLKSHVKKVLDMSSIPLERRSNLIEEYTTNELLAQKSLNRTRKLSLDARVEASNKEILLADYFLVASNFTKRQLVEVGVKSKQIYVVSYGINSNLYRPREAVPSNDSKKLTFIFVGQMSAVKGFYVLVEALSRLPSGSFKCLLIGVPQGSETKIKQLSADFEFLGPVLNDDMPDIYRLADVLVAPSFYDGFGLTVLEAMASGLGVICSRNTGASDLVNHGETGFLVDPNSVDDLYASMQYFLDNPDKLSGMKTKARLQAKNYSWERYDKSIANVIDSINLL